MKNLPDIKIVAIPHHKQRYNTSGDYYKKAGTLNIRVSKMNAKHEFLVAIHELIEWFLIEQKGVTISQIDQFDIEFEKKRKPGNTDEPGDDPAASYYEEHQFATKIEREIADKLGVDWDKYDEHVNSL